MMSELKPCPACGSEAVITGCGGLRAICKNWDCQMTGPRKMDRDDAAAAWNALPRPLRWTKEPPTEPGVYWLRKDSSVDVVKVYRENGELFVLYHGNDEDWDLPEGEWAGPIQEPVE